MGHPHDPVGHSHHNSVWISHENVNGESFWGDQAPGRILHRRIVRYDDADDAARIVAENDWVGSGDQVLLRERRGITVQPLDDGEWLEVIDIQLSAPGDAPVTLGATPFGIIGVRMAKTIGVNDGGGLIRNIFVGIIGSFVGGALVQAGLLQVPFLLDWPWAHQILVSTVGAILVVILARILGG